MQPSDLRALLAKATPLLPLHQGYEDGEDERGAWENPTGAIVDADGCNLWFDDEPLDLSDPLDVRNDALVKLLVALANHSDALVELWEAAKAEHGKDGHTMEFGCATCAALARLEAAK